eukprot:1139552-Pelagomonas_calceolata.AAC.3
MARRRDMAWLCVANGPKVAVEAHCCMLERTCFKCLKMKMGCTVLLPGFTLTNFKIALSEAQDVNEVHFATMLNGQTSVLKGGDGYTIKTR